MRSGQYKKNKPLSIGIIASAIYFFTKDISVIPEMVKGFLSGIALVGYLLGFYGLHHDLSKLSKKKRDLMIRILHK